MLSRFGVGKHAVKSLAVCLHRFGFGYWWLQGKYINLKIKLSECSMLPIGLALFLLALLASRVLFIGVHLSDPGALWADYERRGPRFLFARVLDWITLGGFTITVCVLLYKINDITYPLTTTFIGFFGIQLLSRLQVRFFPRTNIAGAFSEAKINLMVHLLMSVLGAAGVTLLCAMYLRGRS